MATSNTVELVGVYGSDETHALSAWTSTSRDLPQEKRDRIPQLLQHLADNEHGTPFEKSALHFLVTTDIATHIHLLKHRIGTSLNAESARYKEIKEDRLYIPADWPVGWAATLQAHAEEGNRLYHQALADLTSILGKKRAKESARFFKTYNSQIQADVMFNFRSFVHFYRLRARSQAHAQDEVANVAKDMLRLIRDTHQFDHSIAAWRLE